MNMVDCRLTVLADGEPLVTVTLTEWEYVFRDLQKYDQTDGHKILYTLDGKDTPMRYSDILAALPDISQKMLTVALRNLEADGLVLRQAYAEIPPRVEYSITERGKSLMPHINSLIEWALANLADILNDRKKYSSNKNH